MSRLSASESFRKLTAGILPPTVPARELFHDNFVLGRRLGQGQFGTTYVCADKKNGQRYAVKVISKSKLFHAHDVDTVLLEIEIMHHVNGQRHIVGMKGAYEDAEGVYIVMELCEGELLFDRIIKRATTQRRPYSENEAAGLARQIVKMMEKCHSLGVIHRDLKPENLLFKTKDEDSDLMLIDFGLSTWHLLPGEGHNFVCGSLLYMAPEIVRWSKLLRKSGDRPPLYGPEVDIWSAGVIIFILLCGFPPFDHATHAREKVFKVILNSPPPFNREPWPSISVYARDLISRMLQKEPKRRMTAHEALCHPWLAEEGVAPSAPLPHIVADRLKIFVDESRFKKIAMEVIATGLQEEEVAGLRRLFHQVDTDNSGTITFEELKVALKKLNVKMTDEEVQRVMAETDIDHSGAIEYDEFLACTMNHRNVEKTENLKRAFAYFDLDGSGQIQRDELVKACAKFRMTTQEVDECMKEADLNNDGGIDYHEFVSMMHKRNMKAYDHLLEGSTSRPTFRHL